MAFLNTKGLEQLWAHIMARLNRKVDKVDGMGLSSNDFTTEEKEILASLEFATDDDILALMMEVDALPVVMDESGAIMTDEEGAILLA